MNIIKLTEKKKNNIIIVNFDHITHVVRNGEGARLFTRGFPQTMINVQESVEEISQKLEV